MKDRTKEQLIEEIELLRREVNELRQEKAERKRAEEEIKAKSQFFESLIEQSPLPTFVIDPEGICVMLNKAFLKAYNVPKKEMVLGRNALTEPANVRQGVVKYIKEALSGKIVETPEIEFISPYEKKRTVTKSKLFPIFDATNKLTNVVVIHEDITARKRAEEALRKAHNELERRVEERTAELLKSNEQLTQEITERKRVEEALQESEEKYRTTFENTGTAMAILEEDTTISLVNNQFEILVGYPKVEIEGKRSWTEFVHKEDLERMKKYHRKRRGPGGEAPIQYEFRFVDREGNIKNIFLTVEVIPGTKKSVASLMDITERKRAEEQLERSFVDLAETVSRAMESRDPYTSGHQRRVAELARLVGEKMKLDNNKLMGLYIGGLLHDAGKISIPESILSKPGRLSDEERNLVRAHTKQGYEILKNTNLPWPVAEMALHHHERMDGSGYPDGISGDELSLQNRILGVCDVVEAMSSFRPYRPAKGIAEILKEFRSGRGTKYDADVVDVMLEIIESGEFQLSEA